MVKRLSLIGKTFDSLMEIARSLREVLSDGKADRVKFLHFVKRSLDALWRHTVNSLKVIHSLQIIATCPLIPSMLHLCSVVQSL